MFLPDRKTVSFVRRTLLHWGISEGRG